MRRLTKEGLASAWSFLKRDGREVDRSLLAFELGEASPSAVVDALAAYQNPDGGFGRALEPDIRTEASSVIATTVAFQLLSRVEAPADHPMVRGGISYLLDTYEAGGGVWPIVPPEVESGDHAPWWTFAGTREGFGGFGLNPTAEVLRYLLEYPRDVPPEMCRELAEVVVARIADSGPEMEMHDLQCCIRLAESRVLPDGTRETVQKKVEEAADRVVVRNPEGWSGYVTKPLTLVDGPSSSLYALLRDDIPANLDYEIDQQGDDGAWSPAWSWEGEAWPQAEKDWKSLLTARTVATLHAFGRVEADAR